MAMLLGVALTVLLGSRPVAGGSLKDIEHVVIFMQENRSWNSYFGTMAGVRGFNDPNVQVNPDGLPVWHQLVDPKVSDKAQTLLPWYLGYQGGNSTEAIQCMAAGSNGYQENQAAINHGLNNHWVMNNTAWSWGYLKRNDIPVHFAIAEGWTTGDMYQEGQITATCPNRVTLVSGSVNVPGGPQTPDQGGPYLDNNETPGCENGINCYPLKWKTIFEYYEEAGVSWQVYQDRNNFDDNPLAYFQQFQKAPKSSPLAQKGLAYLGLEGFYAAAANGTLPEVSFIVGPAELSEHPPYMPKDGAWLQKKVVDAVTTSPKYSSTLLMISYDESGGFGDHVTPFHSPEGTPGDWMEDPYGLFGNISVGPGVRLPFTMISPWTRGNRVFTERADHNSQILFLEEWLTARVHENVQTDEMVHWRREHMSNLVNALDLDHPDLSIPHIPDAEEPATNSKGGYVGSSNCEAQYSEPRPPVPYGEQETSEALWFEEGYKECVGYLTEGRYLVFERAGRALTNTGNTTQVTTAAASPDHNAKNQRWVVHYSSGEESQIFKISSALDGRWLGQDGSLLPSTKGKQAAEVKVTFLGNGRGYSLQYVGDSSPILIEQQGDMGLQKEGEEEGYRVWSVSYRN
ncbi:hypothetical protein ASPWEDRAFT_51087 [Aspergillus wentii DTO 134E9]|uniref:Ricin B lectin domain-containing protein n=1 Tax=Aspergillus wentii DTO 134E9 TaxID=1073089 RepID=A0A1L9RIR7_ASPWE|nr:uncharacterized protein ASPWEDRAFT_51087 [Aspergillus wentii DTO 134E9]OJJ34830.1 hypothetical protein ASPWEDRAFT_51087 [Aspergillus wentii DTO 134E9]